MALSRTCRQSLLFFLLLSLASADVTFTDLPGIYTFREGNLPFCRQRKTVEIRSQASTISKEQMLFNDATCESVDFLIEELRHPTNAALGIMIRGSGSIRCGSFDLRKVFIDFFSPSSSGDIVLPLYQTPYKYLRGERYLVFLTEFDGGCVYQRTTVRTGKTEPSPTNQPSDANATISGVGAETRKGKRGVNIWAWLAPVLIVVALLVTAAVYFYNKRKNIEAAPAPEAAPASEAASAPEAAPV